MEIVTALTFINQRIIVLATQIHDTIFFKQFTNVLQKTEINHTVWAFV